SKRPSEPEAFIRDTITFVSISNRCHSFELSHRNETMNKRAQRLDRRAFLQQTTRITAVAAACVGTRSILSTGSSPGGESSPSLGRRISYFRNGEIHVNESGQPDSKPITSGHMDFKPSWSKTGDMLVCFRRTKDDPVTANWKSAIFVINIDGTGFH